MRTILLVAAAAMIAGCSEGSRPASFTLYRNSPYGVLRVHFASFDADENNTSGYNRENCEMAARLLNANVAALRKKNGQAGESDVGFWCEPGDFGKDGSIPAHFDSQFPTDA